MPQVMVNLTEDELFELLKKSRAGSAIGAVREAIVTYLSGKDKANQVIVAEDTEKLAQEIVKQLTKRVSEEGTQRLRKKVSSLEDGLKAVKKELKEIRKEIQELESKIEESGKKVELDDATIRKVVREIFEEREKILEDYISHQLKQFRKDISNYQFPSLHQLKTKVEALEKKLNELQEEGIKVEIKDDKPKNANHSITGLYKEDEIEESFKAIINGLFVLKALEADKLLKAGIKLVIVNVNPAEHIVFKLVGIGLQEIPLIDEVRVRIKKEQFEQSFKKKWKEVVGDDECPLGLTTTNDNMFGLLFLKEKATEGL